MDHQLATPIDRRQECNLWSNSNRWSLFRTRTIHLTYRRLRVPHQLKLWTTRLHLDLNLWLRAKATKRQ